MTQKFIRIFSHENEDQSLNPLGTAMYDAGHGYAFLLNESQTELDPFLLTSSCGTIEISSRLKDGADGGISPYFREFLPGKFASNAINNISKWGEASDFDKLEYISEHRTECKHLYLNPNVNKKSYIAESSADLGYLAKKIVKAQTHEEDFKIDSSNELACISQYKSQHGTLDFLLKHNRYVCKILNPNITDCHPKVMTMLANVQAGVGICTAKTFISTIPNTGIQAVMSARFDQEMVNIGRTGLIQASKYNTVSAASLLECLELQKKKPGKIKEHNYGQVVELINKLSINPEKDKHELFKRCLFNIFVSHTDNSLENVIFIKKEAGWQLAPAISVKPTTDEYSLFSTSYRIDAQASPISDHINKKLVLYLAEKFEVPEQKALFYALEISNVLSECQTLFSNDGLETEWTKYKKTIRTEEANELVNEIRSDVETILGKKSFSF